MEYISIKYLSELSSYSSLKVLLTFIKMNTREVEMSLSSLSSETGLSINSIRTAIKELTSLQYIKPIAQQDVNKARSYEILIHMEPTPPETVDGWHRATGARKKSNYDDIIFDYNFYKEDINIRSVANSNLDLTEEEFKRVANKIMYEYFVPVIDANKPEYWWPVQKKLMKELLGQWRTEQILAAIEYWSKINPPPNGIFSLKFFFLKNKSGTSRIMEALDYYKSQYLEHYAQKEAKSEFEKRKNEQLIKAQEEQEKIESEKRQVDSMSNEEFIKSLFADFINGSGD